MVWKKQNAPKTCAKFKTLLPYKERIIHVRWSGEGCWIPLGDLDLGLGYENHTSYPAPGQFILYPGGISETEILLAYGGVQLRQQGRPARRQPLPDHHQGLENLAALGKMTLWQGAQDTRLQAREPPIYGGFESTRRDPVDAIVNACPRPVVVMIGDLLAPTRDPIPAFATSGSFTDAKG